MKKIAILIYFISILSICFGQNSNIQLDVYVPNESTIPMECKEILQTKILDLVSENGFSGQWGSSNLFIFPRISVIEQQITSSPPVQTIVSIHVSLYSADCISKKIFSSVVLKAKGVGRTEEKAITNAIKNIGNNDIMNAFLANTKNKILAYYNSQCDLLDAKIMSLISQNNYHQAMFELSSIPEEAKECFLKAQRMMPGVYSKYINFKCSELNQQAKILWANKDTNKAIELLILISQLSNCSNEANQLIVEIKAYVTEKEKREIAQNELTYKNQEELNKLITTKSFDLAIEYSKENQAYWKSQQQETIAIVIGE